MRILLLTILAATLAACERRADSDAEPPSPTGDPVEAPPIEPVPPPADTLGADTAAPIRTYP